MKRSKNLPGVEVYNARVIDAKVPLNEAIKLKNKLNAFGTGGSDAPAQRTRSVILLFLMIIRLPRKC